MAAQPSHGLGFGDNNDVFICECQRNLLSFNFMGVICENDRFTTPTKMPILHW
jgi:hypothetical protein